MKLLAEKNGYRRHFTKTQWDVLGSDKCGWVLVPEELLNNVNSMPHESIKAKINDLQERALLNNLSKIQEAAGSTKGSESAGVLRFEKPKRRKK